MRCQARTSDEIMNYRLFLVVAVLAPFATQIPQWRFIADSTSGVSVRRDLEMSVELRFGDSGFNFPDLVDATQIQLDKELARRNANFSYRLVDNLVPNNRDAEGLGCDFIVELYVYEEVTVVVQPDQPVVYLTYDLAAVHANDLPFFVVQALLDHLLESDLVASEVADTRALRLEFVQHVSRDAEVQKKLETQLEALTAVFPFVDFDLQFYSSANIEDQPTRFWYTTREEDTEGFYLAVDDDIEVFVSQIIKSVAELLGAADEPGNNLSLRVHGLVRRLAVDYLGRATASPQFKGRWRAQYDDLVRRWKSDRDWEQLLVGARQLHDSVAGAT